MTGKVGRTGEGGGGASREEQRVRATDAECESFLCLCPAAVAAWRQVKKLDVTVTKEQKKAAELTEKAAELERDLVEQEAAVQGLTADKESADEFVEAVYKTIMVG